MNIQEDNEELVERIEQILAEDNLRLSKDKDKIIQKIRDKFDIANDVKIDYTLKDNGEIELKIGNKKATGPRSRFYPFYDDPSSRNFGTIDLRTVKPSKPIVIGDFRVTPKQISYNRKIYDIDKATYARIKYVFKKKKDIIKKAKKSTDIKSFLKNFPTWQERKEKREEEKNEKRRLKQEKKEERNEKRRLYLIRKLHRNEEYLKGKLDDIETAELSKLEDLNTELKENPEYQKKVEKEWKERERGIVDGINYLVENGLVVDGKDNPIDSSILFAEPVGGSSQSDIKVHLYENEQDKTFFIESKLTYDTAEYFKFNVTVDGNKILYDHKFHLSHIDKTKNEKEQKKEHKYIDKLFQQIDLGDIITEVIAGNNDNELTQEWKNFIDNWNEMIRFIQKMFENDSSFEGYKFESPNNKFPEQFVLVGKYYQHYFEFYANVYDTIIDKIFVKYLKGKLLKIGKKTYTRSDFKLSRDDTNKDGVLQSAGVLRTFISQRDVEDSEPLFDEILKIEGKFSALSKRLSKKIRDYRDLSLNVASLTAEQRNDLKIGDSSDKTAYKYNGKITLKDSLKYFYQMFISTTGRKKTNSLSFQKVNDDVLGVMQLTPIVEFNTKRINQAITDYYLKKDNVAYMQVLQDIFMLRKDFDPLGLVKALDNDYEIQLLNDADNTFTCSLVVSDDLSEISLHVRMQELSGNNRKPISFDVRDKKNGFIGTDYENIKNNKLHINVKDFGRKFRINTQSKNNAESKKNSVVKENEIEERVNELLNESIFDEGLELEKSKANQFEVRVTESLREFVHAQKSPYNSLEVEHYEEPDLKYWSDIKVTNPKNNKRFWIEAKEDKYACLGGQSFKYKDGQWICSTLEEDDTLLPDMTKMITESSSEFIRFCKDFLGTEDISLPRDLTDELVYAWKDSGSIEDTENDVLFIGNKIPVEDFGAKIASYYMNSKNEPAYYIQIGDDLYLVDEKTNVLNLVTKDGKPLKTLAEAYRIGRIQFRLKGYDRPQRHYWSIYTDVKILSDKENLDKDYSCSFLDREKWPVIAASEGFKGSEQPQKIVVGGSQNTENDEEITETEKKSNVSDTKKPRHHVMYRSNSMVFEECARRMLQKSENKSLKCCMEEENVDYLCDSIIKTYPTKKFIETLVKRFYNALRLSGYVAFVENDGYRIEYDGKGISYGDSDFEDKFEFHSYSRNIENGIDGTLEFSFAVSQDKASGILNEKFMSKLIEDCHYCGYDMVNHIVRNNGGLVEFHFLFETKYQPNDITIGKKLYHLSPFRNNEKILTRGIFPKSDSENKGLRLNHDPRTYLFNVFDNNVFAKFLRDSGKNNENHIGNGFFSSDDVFGVYEIETDKLNNVHFYRDNMFYTKEMENPVALYVYDSIPPTAIRLVEKIDAKGNVLDEVAEVLEDVERIPGSDEIKINDPDYDGRELLMYRGEDTTPFDKFAELNDGEWIDDKNIVRSRNSLRECLKKYDKFYFIGEGLIKTYSTIKFMELLTKKLFKEFDLDGNAVCVKGNDGETFHYDGKNVSGGNVEGETCVAANFTARNYHGGVAGYITYEIFLPNDRVDVKNLKNHVSKIAQDCYLMGYNIVTFRKRVVGENLDLMMVFESKYQKRKLAIPDKMFHISPARNEDKILSRGLMPKSNTNRLGHVLEHPDRVYLFTRGNVNIFIQFARQIEKTNDTYSDGNVISNGKFDVFEIDTGNIGGLDFYADNMFNGGESDNPIAVYTYDTISPKAIRKIGEVDVESGEYHEVDDEDTSEITERFERICNEDSVDDVISDMKKVPSTNDENPDTKKIQNVSGSKILTLVSSLDGRLILINSEGETVRRDDNKELYFDDKIEAQKWVSERGYEIDNSIEDEGLRESADNVELISNVPEEKIKDILDNQTIENKRYERSQFTKYFGIKETNWNCLMGDGECLAIATVAEDSPFKGYAFVQEIQTLKKGFGRRLLEEIFRKYGKVSLMANTMAGEDLMKYYRGLGLEEIAVQDSVYGCPAHFFCTKECDYDKLEAYFIAFYSNDEGEEIEEAEEEIGGEKSDAADDVSGVKIWIDDLREAPEGFLWIHTVRDFIRYIDYHGTDGISLIDTDHDAGDYQKFGGDYIRCFDYLDYIGAKNITVHIHSANPVGANNIRRIISKNKEDNGWCEIRNTEE